MVARRLTLGHVFALTMAGLALLLGALFSLLLAHGPGFGRDGALQLGGERERWQLSVYRVLDGDQNRLVTRRTSRHGPRWVVELRDRLPNAGLLDAPLSLSAAETASAHDFAEQSHFARVFKEIVGVTPGAWQRRNRP